jgi:hypothetical protein
MIDNGEVVNRTAYMDFREATDGLFDRVDHANLAKALGVSVATIRQARLQSSAKAHRIPPSDWPDAVIRLAEERVWHYRRLIEDIRNERKAARL